MQYLRAARLQNELAPGKKFESIREKRYEKCEKGSEKRSETCPKSFKPLSRRSKMSHPHFSKSFSPPKICTKIVVFFTAGLCRDSYANNTPWSSSRRTKASQHLHDSTVTFRRRQPTLDCHSQNAQTPVPAHISPPPVKRAP